MADGSGLTQYVANEMFDALHFVSLCCRQNKTCTYAMGRAAGLFYAQK